MSEDRIKRKNLLPQIAKLKKKDWIKMAENLELLVTCPNTGSSHSSIRIPTMPDDVRGVITVVYDGMSQQVNIKVFKKFLDRGFGEDKLFKALKLIK